MEICVCVCDMIIGQYDGNCVCGMCWHQIVLLSCLCFAEMSIYFCFGEFRPNSRSIYVLFWGKVMPNFFMTLMHACIFIINLFIITMHTFMMVSGTMVDRWLRSAVQDMKENNLTEVLCPCRKCKGIVWLDPYDNVVSKRTCSWLVSWMAILGG